MTAARSIAVAAAVWLAPDRPTKALAVLGIRGRPQEAWEDILKRDPCAYCGRRGAMTIDHISPRSHGYAKAGASNGAPACFDCNQAKADDTLLELLARPIPVPPRPRPDFDVIVSRTAKRHAHRCLGSAPAVEWWEGIADRIRSRGLRATLVKLTDGKERAWWVVPAVSRDGVDLEILVLARTYRRSGRVTRVEFLGMALDRRGATVS